MRQAELATVAQQDDFMKRARGNGAARIALCPEESWSSAIRTTTPSWVKRWDCPFLPRVAGRSSLRTR
ncbi:hypothetical protein [Gordonia sp. C13]|uniref:hypothetical protein n=1 Tax=Gordonia sp. C13 TaxID=2935078 RepID=UPI00200B6C31|nr:hypothetical protein [Gordonia sp. C13]MCK8616131.1 hypothetical protein [Gordonia sp. C13]